MDWLEEIRELYKKEKSKITPGDIRPVDFAFFKDDVESVYFTKTMSAAKQKNPQIREKLIFYCVYWYLLDQKLFIISDEVNETIDLKDIVHIETIAEKFGIPIKK